MTNGITCSGGREERRSCNAETELSLVGPRGVKFRLNAVDAFALMNRVKDKINPFGILRRAEVLWKMPGMFAMFTSMALICYGDPWLFFLILPSSALAKMIFIDAKFYMSYFSAPFRWVGSVYSALTGYGLFFIGLTSLAYFEMGWLGVCLYVLINAARIGVEGRMEERNFIRLLKEGMQFLNYDSKCFLMAFERIARKYSRDTSWSINPQKDSKSEAIDLMMNYFNEFPKAASRFDRCKGFELPFQAQQTD